MYSVTDSESASYTVKRVVTVKEKSEPTEPTKPTEPTELTKPTEPTKPGDTVKPNKPDAGNKQPGLSKTGASVSGVFARSRHCSRSVPARRLPPAVGASPGAESADRHMECRSVTYSVAGRLLLTGRGLTRR